MHFILIKPSFSLKRFEYIGFVILQSYDFLLKYQ